MKFITNNNLLNLFGILQKDYDIFIPVKREKNRFYVRYAADTENQDINRYTIGEVRSFEPLKSFFTPAREKVAEGFGIDVARPDQKPFCIVGAKGCDLKGFRVQDFVFRKGDFQDPFYMEAREKNFIVSADCTCAIDTCFCLALDVKPYPENNFDINLSQVEGGFVVETGSPRGQSLVESNPSLFAEPLDSSIVEKNEQRKRVTAEVKQNLKEHGVPVQDRFEGIIKKNYDSEIWREEARTCVECGACNTICPTCHCFLLYDQMDAARMERLRVWDSCMIKDFAKVAAGVNPRPWLWMRLRNRFEKKFDFFPTLADVYACTGCGRCISACPAKIDIRKVLQRLVKDAQKQPV